MLEAVLASLLVLVTQVNSGTGQSQLSSNFNRKLQVLRVLEIIMLADLGPQVVEYTQTQGDPADFQTVVESDRLTAIRTPWRWIIPTCALSQLVHRKVWTF